MRLSDVLEELLIATRANGRSERTAADYAQRLAPLIEFLDDPEIGIVTAQDLRRYITDLRSRTTRSVSHSCREPVTGELATASTEGYVRVLRRLFSFAMAEVFIAENPASRIRVPKRERGESKAIAMDDIARPLEAIDGDDVLGRRDKALLLLLAASAARVGGLAKLRASDVDLKQRTVYLREKGGKGRYAFFSPVTQEALRAWLRVRPADNGDNLSVNLGPRGCEDLTPQGISDVLRRLKRKAGVRGAVNPHAFRHAFAREYLSNGGDLSSLADIMGHSDVRVTWSSYAIYCTAELQAKHASLAWLRT